MSYRYVKDYNMDGWPIKDADKNSVLTKDQTVDRLNFYEEEIRILEHQLEQANQEVARLRGVQSDS